MAMDQSSTLLTATDIGVRLSDRWIFRRANVSVAESQLVCVIGGNGAGKSTCLKTLLGLIPLTEGQIEHSSSLTIGYVPQKLTITPILPLTLRRLLTLGNKHKHTRADIEHVLYTVGLEKLGNPSVTNLSGGEFQRLMIARAILRQPQLLVLDEPLQGIDVANTDILNELILTLRDELGCGILLVSHDIERVFQDADDVLVLVPHEHDESITENPVWKKPNRTFPERSKEQE